MRNILFFFVIVLLNSACGELDPSVFDAVPRETPTLGADYFPNNTGNFWIYSDGNNDFKIIVDGDSTLSGISYKKYLNETTGNIDLFAKNGTVISQLTPITSSVADSAVSRLLLSDYNIEKEWSDMIPLSDTEFIRYDNAIDLLDDIRRLNGRDYDDIVRVRRRVYSSILNPIDSTYADDLMGISYYWFAKDIGLIEWDAFNGSFGRIKDFSIQ